MREITTDVYWLNECYELTDEPGVHEHVSVYVLQDGDTYIAVDTGAFHDRESITESIEEVTDGEGLDALILSHSDYPHSANVETFHEEWEDLELVASSGSPEAQGLPPSARKCTIGESMEIQGRKFSFIDPPLADRSHTTWIYDHQDGILFTADGYGSRHEPGECNLPSDKLDEPISFENVYEYHKETLVWLKYVDPSKLEQTLTSILDDFPPEYVAPVHGHPIAAADLDRYMDNLLGAAEQIADEYEVPEVDSAAE